MVVNNSASEDMEGSEEHDFGNSKKGELCYVVEESLPELCRAVM